MDVLSYGTLARIGYEGRLVPRDAPIKVLQFGEGNFLRAFVDRYFDLADELTGWDGRVCMVQPASTDPAMADGLNGQDCLYTVCTRGSEGGHTVDEVRVVSCCSGCLNPCREEDYCAMMEIAVSDELEIIVSNTTEAGIVYDPSCRAGDTPPTSFPAKLAQVLHERWAAGKDGVIVLPCELIDDNAGELLRVVKLHVRDWGWEPAFGEWLEDSCTFCNTLVDTIVPGRVRDPAERAALEERLGYTDRFLTMREPFQMWGIEAPSELGERLPFIQAGLPGAFLTSELAPYKKRKVRILNGSHTALAPGGWLAGIDIVRDCMEDDVIGRFVEKLQQEEIIPALSGELDLDDLEEFAAAVGDRFVNPFIDHQLLSICLNSTSKWRTRDLPTLLDLVESTGGVPRCLATSLSLLIAFYTTGFEGRDGEGLHLRRADGTAYTAQDDAFVLDFYAGRAGEPDDALVADVLSCEQMWGRDLTEIAGLEDIVTEGLATVRTQGAKAAFASCLG